MDIFEQIKNLLDQNQIKYQVMEHEPVLTSEQASAVRGTKMSEGAKALILEDKKENIIMVVFPADRKLDSKLLRQLTGLRDLRFIDQEKLEQKFQVKTGGVPPFGNLWNLATYFDKTLLNEPQSTFNAGRRDRSIIMNTEDLVKAVNPICGEFTK